MPRQRPPKPTLGPSKKKLPPVGEGRARARLRKLGMDLDPAGRTRLKRKAIKRKLARRKRPV